MSGGEMLYLVAEYLLTRWNKALSFITLRCARECFPVDVITGSARAWESTGIFVGDSLFSTTNTSKCVCGNLSLPPTLWCLFTASRDFNSRRWASTVRQLESINQYRSPVPNKWEINSTLTRGVIAKGSFRSCLDMIIDSACPNDRR